eukprot:TRINITY_DN26629_c0_g1_i2.p1 TRINITY_DN26629_c0_g1~~TRINITY_DN26629_c0_g1_i2.p1  ORF type:complete len:238 (-),score=36.84 TRINITY_DN26629_c0_g1_i2:157-870(-)
MARGIPTILLDRPNPINGLAVSGPALDLNQVPPSRYGSLARVPHRHGMTVGELCHWALQNQTNITSLLTVYRLTGWTREMTWEQTGLPWIPPSPNLPTPASARAYVSTVFLEATSMSEGRGTNTPFQVLGAPWLNGSWLADQLNRLEGANGIALFRSSYFEPEWFKYNKTICQGVQYVREVKPDLTFRLTLELLKLVILHYPDDFSWDGSWFGWPQNGTLFDLYACLLYTSPSPRDS